MMNSSPPTRRWWQRFSVRLSLRMMMVAVLIAGVGLGWVVHRSRLQRQAVAAVRGAKGHVSYDWQIKDNVFQKRNGPRGPAWLRRLMGDEPFQSITRVALMDGPTDDAVIAALASQRGIDSLTITDSRLTEAGFASLGGLTTLHDLTINGKTVGDAGMAHVGRLINLTRLHLAETSVGDAGLAHLGGLRKLELLRLDRTPVTDAGMASLASMPSLKVLGMSYAKVGDAGLAHLSRLPLVEVMIYECPATPAGVAALAKALPRSATILGP